MWLRLGVRRGFGGEDYGGGTEAALIEDNPAAWDELCHPPGEKQGKDRQILGDTSFTLKHALKVVVFKLL